MKKVACLAGCVLLLFAACSKNPVADFTFSSPVEVGEEVMFTNQSENADKFFWDFGDGYTSTLRDPVHTFGTPGIHTISLQATGEKESVYANRELSVTGITYSFKNKTFYDMPGFFSYYWDGNTMLDFVDHGTLYMDKETVTVITKRNSIHFGLFIGEDVFVSEELPLIANKHNQIVIGDLILSKGTKGATEEEDRQLSALRSGINGKQIH